MYSRNDNSRFVLFPNKSVQGSEFCNFLKQLEEDHKLPQKHSGTEDTLFFFFWLAHKNTSFWNYKMYVNYYLFVGVRTSFMENGDPKWRPPSVEFFYPLMHHSSWTNNDCWTQSLVPKSTQAKTKPSTWNKYPMLK